MSSAYADAPQSVDSGATEKEGNKELEDTTERIADEKLGVDTPAAPGNDSAQGPSSSTDFELGGPVESGGPLSHCETVKEPFVAIDQQSESEDTAEIEQISNDQPGLPLPASLIPEAEPAIVPGPHMVREEPQEMAGTADLRPQGSSETSAIELDVVLPNSSQAANLKGESDEEDDESEESELENEEVTSVSSDEEELPVVENPSQDIRNDLVDALEDNQDVAGTFFSSQSFSISEAPNPLLTVENFGVVGLPLSVPEAKRLITSSVTQRAPFGMGERTVVDKSVRDTWEIDGSKIHFGNQKWNNWVEKVVVPHVCGDLGVNIPSTEPRAELYKLLMYETGSHFLPHQDTEKAPGMFATIVIVLPSEFSGGSLHLSHAGKTQTIDIAGNSLSGTHALAWYTDVYHSVYPVMSGYRLALSYNLVHSKSLKPSLHMIAEKSATLRHVLLSWKQAKEGRVELRESVPDQLCYLLSHEYSQVNLLASVLKGTDARLVAQLKPIAEELNFGLFIANIELYKNGSGDDCGYRENRGRYRNYYDDEDEDEDEDDVGFAEVFEETLRITNIVDLDGMPMGTGDVSIDMEDVIPEPFGEDEEPDRREYEGYMGNGAGTLEYWYHRSVLIFCPDKELFDVGNITDYVCKTLANCDSQKSSRKEMRLANRLIVNCSSGTMSKEDLKRAIGVLTVTAVKWRNIELWTKAVSACPPDSKLQCVGVDGFIKAYVAFGFIPLETHLDAAIQGDSSNLRRFTVIQELLRLGNDDNDEALTKWCNIKNETVLSSLKKATEQEADLLVSIAKQRDAQVLRDVILPQLTKTKCGISFWIAFLQKLKQEESAVPLNAHDLETIIASQVSAVMSTATPFPAKLVKSTTLYLKDRMEPSVDIWLRNIKLCISLNYPDKCSAYFARMVDEYNKATEQSRDWIADSFIVPAITKFDAEAATYKPDTFGRFAEFFKFAMDVYVKRTVIQGKGNFVVSTLMIAAKRCGDAEALKAKLSPMYAQLAQKRPLEAQEMLSTLARQKGEMAPDQPDTVVYNAIIDGLMKSIIAVADLEAKPTSQTSVHGYGYGRYGMSHNVATTVAEPVGLKLIKLCHSTGCQAHVPSILDKILMPKANCAIQKQIENGLVPLLPQLKTYLSTLSQAITNEPYASFAAKAIKGYIKTVLGQKPKETVSMAQLNTIGCNRCEDCKYMRQQFLSENKVISMARKQNIRNHLERELMKARPWSVTWTTIRSGSPQTLQITRPDSIMAPIIWSKKQATGLKFVQSIGDDVSLQRILGAQFATVAGVLGMRVTVQQAVAPAPMAPRAQVAPQNAPQPVAGPSHIPSAIPATKKRPSTGGSQPPKRTKLDDDVIDLTDSPPKKK